MGSIPNTSMLLLKTDNNGNLLWHNSFYFGDVSNTATPIFKTTDGGYAFAGTGQIDYGVADYVRICVKKTNANGLTCYEQFPAITANAASIVSNGTATVVTSPSVTVMPPPSYTITNMIVNAYTGCSNVGIEEMNPQNSSPIYPNIMIKNGSISISLDEDLKNAAVAVYNVMGEAIHNYPISDKGKIMLLTLQNNINPGMYFIRITQGKKIIIKKIIVL